MQNLLNELQKIGFVDTNDVDSNKNEFLLLSFLYTSKGLFLKFSNDLFIETLEFPCSANFKKSFFNILFSQQKFLASFFELYFYNFLN